MEVSGLEEQFLKWRGGVGSTSFEVGGRGAKTGLHQNLNI